MNQAKSTIHLLYVSLDSSYRHTLHFSSKTDQYNYFYGKKIVGFSFTDYTFVRHDNVLRVKKNIEELNAVNYVMYKNKDKWYYAFIVGMEYISDEVTALKLETDVIQTWMLDVSLRESFVEREHVENDTIGLHLVDEGLETGDYITYRDEKSGVLDDVINVLAVSDNTPFGNNEQIGNRYGNIIGGLTYYAFPNNEAGAGWLKDTINLYNNASKIDAIAMIFTVPLVAFSQYDSENYKARTAYLDNTPVPGDFDVGDTFVTYSKNYYSLDGYQPTNKKLFTAPYNFLYVSNNLGGYAKYEYEKFQFDTIQFFLKAPLTPNPRVIMYPTQYDKTGINLEEAITLEGYPLGSWSNDTYTAWFNANIGNTISTGLSTGAMAGGAIGSMVNLGVGSAIGAGVGALAGIAGAVGSWYTHYIQPDNARGVVGAGSLMFSMGMLDFHIKKKGIRNEYAQRIDGFLTQYGYKVNTFKVPQYTSRKYFNYIKTRSLNLTGQLPQADKQKIIEVFDNGITFWHNPAYFLAYGVDNTIV